MLDEMFEQVLVSVLNAPLTVEFEGKMQSTNSTISARFGKSQNLLLKHFCKTLWIDKSAKLKFALTHILHCFYP